jgi:hypothetical protein
MSVAPAQQSATVWSAVHTPGAKGCAPAVTAQTPTDAVAFHGAVSRATSALSCGRAAEAFAAHLAAARRSTQAARPVPRLPDVCRRLRASCSMLRGLEPGRSDARTASHGVPKAASAACVCAAVRILFDGARPGWLGCLPHFALRGGAPPCLICWPPRSAATAGWRGVAKPKGSRPATRARRNWRRRSDAPLRRRR